MSTKFKTLLSLTTVAAFFASAAAMADYRDYNDKAWNSIYQSTHSVATARSNRSAAPMIVRSEPAPAAVAQAPTNTRVYSYEPLKDAGSAPTAQATPKATGSNRSFSYEPATSAPVMTGGRSPTASGFSIDVGRHAKGY
jgi:hypothetical protein